MRAGPPRPIRPALHVGTTSSHSISGHVNGEGENNLKVHLALTQIKFKIFLANLDSTRVQMYYMYMRKYLFLTFPVLIGLVLGASVAAVNPTPEPGVFVPQNCYAIDACSANLICKKQGSVWVAISPAGEALYKSGTVKSVLCRRLQYADSTCVNGTRNDYNSQSCGYPFP